MDGRNDTTSDCSVPALEPCYSQMICPANFTTTFHRFLRNQIWQVNALLFTEAFLAVIIVGVGAYGQRYRHHPFTRFIFLGATTLFLPIVSSVVSTISNSTNPSYVKIFDVDLDYGDLSALVAKCDAFSHFIRLVIWAFLVQIVMVNTSTVSATEGREGQSKGPPINLIIQGVWTIYLGFTFVGHDLAVDEDYLPLFVILIAPFVLLCAKLVLKCYAFEKARRSFALGRNPGLTFVYMEKVRIQEANQQNEAPVGSDPPPPPPLLVMREEEKQVVIQSRGYAFKDESGRGVTLDRIWQLDTILSPQLKGLCLSFALFKLLRCRFARYKLTNAGPMGTWTLTFFRSLSLQSGEHDRIFKIIAQEISFVHDYYYSSLPICYSNGCLPILSILLSLLTIIYCMFLVVIVVLSVVLSNLPYLSSVGQLRCRIWWIHNRLVSNYTEYSTGRFFVDLVLLLLLALLVMVAEVRDTVSYICCNWTKVILICRYVINHTSSQHSLRLQKWVISFLLRCRCKLIMKEHWNEEMSQCSVLVLHHRTTLLPAFVWRLLPLPDQKWKVKVTAAVKVCIINALRSVINGGLSKGVSSLRRSQFGKSFLLACDGKDTTETILIWHIATCIVQVRHHSGEASDSDHKTVATQLSQYCAYLVSWCPQLLPDNSAWSKGLYLAVKKDAEGALARYSVAESSTPEDERALDDYSVAAEEESSTAEDERAFSEHPVADRSSREEDGYQKLVRLLSDNSKHEVVKDGAKLGKQLLELETMEDEETMWKLLAEFWSEMILYLAPSDNLKGHSDAIARGDELITLLWALLFHAGIDSRPGEDDGAAAATSPGVV